MADHLLPEILKARFVGLSESNGALQKRQLPVEIGDESELTIQFGDENMLATFMDQTNNNSNLQKEYQTFEENIKILTQTELFNSLKCKLEEMLTVMSSTVSCVGCRRSVECVIQLVSDMNYPTLSPIKLHKHQNNSLFEFTLDNDYLQSPKKLFMLLYVCKPNMEYLVNNIPKSRKNKRCNLHCLDSHKVKGVGMWMDFWRSLNSDCRDEIVTINIDAFVEALDSYLQKHRFCQECKGKVEKAYKLLLKDVKPDENDLEYNEIAFNGIKVCKADRHLHIDSSDEIVSNLISRAEPELSNRRERHAKTMDVAQEEVLTCLGIVLHEKLHKLNQKVKAEEQTWLILVNTCLECLKRHLVLAVEEKRGYTNMDLFLLEHEEETKKKEMKKEIKREKKRKKKMAKKTGSDMNSTGGHSPSKDSFGLFADDDDDDDDDDDEEEEEDEKEASKSSTKSPESQRETCDSEEVSHEEEVTSEWQVVDNQCKQCNRQQRSRGLGDATSDLSGSFRSQTSKGLSSTVSNVINRHTNNNAQITKPSALTGKKKHSDNSKSQLVTTSVSCCGQSRNASKSDRQQVLPSNQQQRNNRCSPQVSTTSNNKRSSCARLSSTSSKLVSCASNGVSLSSSTSHASSQSPSQHHSCGSSAQTSSSSSSSPSSTTMTSAADQSPSPSDHPRRSDGESTRRSAESPSVQPQQQHQRGGRSRRNGGPHAGTLSPSSNDSGCCRSSRKNELRSPNAEVTVNVSALLPSPTRPWRCEDGGAKDGGRHSCTNHSSSEDVDNGEDFLTEQERVFYQNNWEEIKEERERLRNKLRQAWSEKTKATTG